MSPFCLDNSDEVTALQTLDRSVLTDQRGCGGCAGVGGHGWGRTHEAV